MLKIDTAMKSVCGLKIATADIRQWSRALLARAPVSLQGFPARLPPSDTIANRDDDLTATAI
ncbi:MAG: hypothetical protein HQ465_04875 [Rhodospirillales bacterium]|nr:hypothetical protein [Rhodospirillales bacterium]